MEKYVKPLCVLGEALMDCVAQAGGDMRPLRGGSPYNMARAAALAGATVHYLNPLSTDLFGQDLGRQLRADGCDRFQGFLFSRPREPGAEPDSLLRRRWRQPERELRPPA